MDIFPKKSYGQQAPEKVLNITNHQENANKNYNEISPYTCQDGFIKKTGNNKNWQGCMRKGKPGELSVEI